MENIEVRFNNLCVRMYVGFRGAVRRFKEDETGQGTTEYAILVGVLVVIAMLAIMSFRGKLTELWQSIADGINGL